MENLIDTETISQFQTLLRQFQLFGVTLLLPWRLYQIAMLLGCFAAGKLIALFVAPKMKNWMHHLEGWPKWRLRFLLLINQRIASLSFVLLGWILVVVLREVTWPSRSYLISLVVELATAWLVISISARLIQNKIARKLVRWGALIYVTISILGLSEFSANILDGFAVDLGSAHISLLLILKTIVILAGIVIGARFISAVAAQKIENSDDLSPSMKVLSIKAMQLLLYGIATVFGLQAIGFDITSLTVLSGAIGLGLGFGLQKVVSNLVSGVILLLDKSIKPGDVISLDETFGWISSLGARYVSVLTRNGTEFLIPNEDLITNRVINWSHSSDLVRLDIHFGVSYDSDPHEVKRVASLAPTSVSRVISRPMPVCHVTKFGDSSIDMVLRFWIRDPTKGLTNVRGDVYLALWDALKAANIQIPYPRRDVTILEPPRPVPTDQG